MAAAIEKRGSITPKMGRPTKGALSTYPRALLEKIKELRKANEGWGSISILVELKEEYNYSTSELPSADSIQRFLKQEGLIKDYEPRGTFPTSPCKKPEGFHDLWEMDAQGAIKVSNIGYHSIINMKEGLSKKHCIAFPVAVKNYNTQPKTIHYKWAFRLAFIESGLPKAVQVDKDSVFIENRSKSPYPSKLHLWLIGLGIELCFITVRPPQKQGMVERSHQTIEKQAIKGKDFDCWLALFKNIEKRRKRLNEIYPSRSLGRKAPLEAFPEAVHSGRTYHLKKEFQLLDLNRIYNFLAEGKWYRIVSQGKMVSIGAIRYYLKNAIPKSQLQITFDKQTKQFIFRNVNEQIVAQLPIKGISKEELIGDATSGLVSTFKKFNKARDFPLP